MRSLFLLLKLNLTSYIGNFRTSSLRKVNGKLDISRLCLYITAAIGILVMAGGIIYLEVTLYHAIADFQMPLLKLDLETLIIGLALMMSMIVTLIFGIFHTLGAMYFNRDTASMAYLPISARMHMAAKWLEIYLFESLFSISLLLPLLICHGIATGSGILYYLGMLLIVLTAPLYPLSIGLLLSSILGRITSLTRHKEVWVVLGTIMMLVIVLGTEWMLLPKIPDDADATFFLNMLVGQESLINFLIGAFPPVMWALDALSGNAAMLALFTGIGVAAITAVIWLMGGSYLNVCLLHTEQGTRKKRVRGREANAISSHSPFVAVFLRELNEILKTPVYLLNAVLGVMMMPIMLFGMSAGITAAEEEMPLLEMLDELLGMLSASDITLIIAALLTLMSLMNTVSATAISREGRRLPIMRMIPVSPRVILWAKLAVSLVFIGIGSVLVGAAIVMFLGTAYLPHALAAVILSDLLACAIGIGSITVDVIKPVLNWKNETEVMKQNMNTLFSMLISMVMIALPVVPAVLMVSLPPWTRMCAVCGIVAVELIGSLILMRRVTEPRFAALEP